MRGGWPGDDDRGYDDYYERDFYDRPPARHYNRSSKPKDEDVEGFQPAMMSFKSFLQTQDDQISDEEAIKKYGEYKMEFKRQQLNEFFVTHKEEEWFKQKYHPDDSVKRKDEMKDFLQKRVEVFNELLENGKIKQLKLDNDMQDSLIRLLDSVVIKLEGGTDFDLTVLDLPDPEDDVQKKDDSKNDDEDDKRRDDDDPPADRDSAVMNKAQEMLDFLDAPKQEESKKRKREEEEEAEARGDELREEVEDVAKSEEDKPATEETQEEEKTEDEKKDISEEGEEKENEKTEDDVSDKPRALHKTSSIFLRNLPPTVTKVEIEAMCKRYDGFLRSAIADPAPDRRWFRRGWVTYKRDVKIKDICYNLNNIRLRDCELGPIVNRDLTKRVRTVPGITQDKKIVRNDIKLAAKIITNLDNKWGLWKPETGAEDDKDDVSVGLVSANPLLNNITDYLIEEASAEEEELLGMKEGEDEDGKDEGVTVQRDEELIDVLDKMILYLRIVHSVDFYNHSEYPNEDEMPNRCGILHARGSLPATKTKSSEIEDYISTFEKKMGGFLVLRADLTDDEATKLGLKNEAEEVEKFISANTQELGKVRNFLNIFKIDPNFVSQDKWLCPLSGKKFKGPDFVRKHILNKHVEKIDEVKKEVNFFNAYLKVKVGDI